MNIFVLSNDPIEAAHTHCDAHVRKMIVEAAQMLSTAHRILDGALVMEPKTLESGKVKMVKRWRLINLTLDNLLYEVTHDNHPSNIWTRATRANYKWHYELFCALCDEYTFRYGKIHKTDSELRFVLGQFPANLQDGPLTQFPLAMKSEPQCIDHNDPIGSYRKFYFTKASKFSMTWKKRGAPHWWIRAGFGRGT